jgi:hypothetical protein
MRFGALAGSKNPSNQLKIRHMTNGEHWAKTSLEMPKFFMKFRGPQALPKQTTQGDGLPHGLNRLASQGR